jgi:LPXTG-motif cell wall-anchored protein
MRHVKTIAAAVLALAAATFVWAQNAKVTGGGPTANDYRLKIVQPVEGAKMTGPTIQVIVDTEIPGETDVRRDTNSMPRPDVQVFLDDSREGRMRDEKNIVTLDNVTPGTHKLTLLAINRAGEVFDRKVVNFVAVAPPVQPANVTVYNPRPVPPPAPVEAAVPPPAPPAPATMPKTATADPLYIAAGLALLAGGLVLRRIF